MIQTPELTKQYILSYVTEEEIYCKYLNIFNVDLNTFYINSLREDDEPSCRFFISNYTNTLKFNDFAWKVFDCWEVAQIKTGAKNFYETLKNIAIDFHLINGTTQKLEPRPKTIYEPKKYKIKIKRKEFTKKELDFWTPNETWKDVITTDLLQSYKIYSISTLFEYIQDTEFIQLNLKMHFAYHWKDYIYQIYVPFSKKRRFINSSNIKFGDLEYLDLNCNYVVITKAKKCSTFLRIAGVNSCFIINEVIKPKEILNEIYTRYFGENIMVFTLFDNDKTGLVATVNYRTEGCIPLLIPKWIGKDFTDYAKYDNYETIKQEIKQMKEKWKVN